jgi:hypothetical protein
MALRTKPTPPARHGLRAILPRARLPRTVQLCVHCHQNAAGFWVRRKDAAVARRPWCLSCCQEVDLGSCDVTPFAS